jgi:hypothetical protein
MKSLVTTVAAIFVKTGTISEITPRYFLSPQVRRILQNHVNPDLAPAKRRVYDEKDKKMQFSRITLDMGVAGIYNSSQR